MFVQPAYSRKNKIKQNEKAKRLDLLREKANCKKKILNVRKNSKNENTSKIRLNTEKMEQNFESKLHQNKKTWRKYAFI